MKLLFASLAVLVSVLAPPAVAQESGQRPRLVLEGLDGSRRELDASGVSIEDPRTRDAYLVRPQGFAVAAQVEAVGAMAQVRLADGDELRGRIAGGEGESLHLELIGGVELPIDITQIEEILLPANLPQGQLEPMEAPAEGDRLYRRTGSRLDRIDGTVDSFEAEGIRFDSVLGAKTLPWDEVAALYVEVLGDSDPTPTPGRTPVVCDLIDGSRVRGELIRIDSTTCRMRVAGAELALELAHVVEIVVDDGALLFLSEVTALREEEQGVPFGDELGMVWPHRVDRNTTGGALRTGGRVWRRGIGMHAPTRVLWSLDGEYRRLRGHVGIDDSALFNPEDSRGSVIFRVLLDGKQVWESSVVRGGDGAIVIPEIQLGRAKELTLEADMAGDFRGDRANWLRMMMIR